MSSHPRVRLRAGAEAHLLARARNLAAVVLAVAVALLVVTAGWLSAPVAAGASTPPAIPATPYDYDPLPTSTTPSTKSRTDARGLERAIASGSRSSTCALALRLATKVGDIGGAKFAQKSFSEKFSDGGLFAGQTIDDVAGQLRSGALSAKDVPISVIVRAGKTLILNTRSPQALTRAGVSRKSW